MNVRLTALDDGLGHDTNCRVRVVMCRTRDGFAGATVTTDKPCERGHRPMPDLYVVIGGQNLDEIRHNIGSTNILMTASLASETVQRALADGRDGIAQRTAKRVRRHVACIMIQKEQAERTHRRIRVAERSHLQGSDRNLLAEPRSTFLRKRSPSMGEIVRDFEVKSHLRIQSKS
jgi:hypothetical protein